MNKIIFVCTGNICRGPMAEAIAKSIFTKKKKNMEVISRGIAVFFPAEANENSVKALLRYGLDISSHIAKQINTEELQECRLVLTMTLQQKEYIKKIIGQNGSAKVFTLMEYVKVCNGTDIPDPYGKEQDIHDEIAENMFKYIDILSDLID